MLLFIYNATSYCRLKTFSQQQNGLVSISLLQGIGGVATDGPRLEPGSDVSPGGLASNLFFFLSVRFASISLSVLAVGLQSWVNALACCRS